jgi:hypothetical protein
MEDVVSNPAFNRREIRTRERRARETGGEGGLDTK